MQFGGKWWSLRRDDAVEEPCIRLMRPFRCRPKSTTNKQQCSAVATNANAIGKIQSKIQSSSSFCCYLLTFHPFPLLLFLIVVLCRNCDRPANETCIGCNVARFATRFARTNFGGSKKNVRIPRWCWCPQLPFQDRRRITKVNLTVKAVRPLLRSSTAVASATVPKHRAQSRRQMDGILLNTFTNWWIHYCSTLKISVLIIGSI